MRPLLTFLIAALYCIQVQAQSFNWNSEDSLYIHTYFKKTEAMIPMRDGIKLYTAIYTPVESQQTYPILLYRTPYSCAPYGPGKMTPRLVQYIHLMRAGYILVFQDVRGRYSSEGTFVDVRPHLAEKKSSSDIDESSDTYDTIEWLLKNVKEHNGRVGQLGISYPGFYAAAALPGAHPALKAVSPQAPVTDWWVGDDFHHHGAFFLLDAFSFYYSFGKERPVPTTEHASGFKWPHGDSYRFMLETGALKNFKKYFDGPRKFWDDMFAHPDYDAWWKARNIRNHLKNVQPAVMTVGGLFDAEDCFGAFATYKAIESQNKGNFNIMVQGPWSHGGWSRDKGDALGNVYFGQRTAEYYRQNIELPFFNHFLKDQGPLELPEALVFVTGENQWQSFSAWPPATSKTVQWYLHSGGKISAEKPNSNNSFTEYISDPAHPVPYTEHVHLNRTKEYMLDDQRFAARRPDVLTFQTEVLTEDWTLTGPVIADLIVSTTGTDADFVVKLIDVFPDSATQNPYSKVPMNGYQMLVRGEVMRGRYRNSFEQPQAFVAGQATPLKLTLPDVAHTFKKGHRLMVQIQSSWFPLVDRNPQQFINIYQANDADFIKATHRVFHSKDKISSIQMTLLPK